MMQQGQERARTGIGAVASAEVADPAPPVAEADRVRLAASPDTSAELLNTLASDPSVAVRAAVAMNVANPPLTDQLLVLDGDERVRMVLARKLASLAPDLARADQDRLARYAWDTLSRLVSDTAESVRRMVAEQVRDLPEAPRALILRLAQDTAFSVSDPVLRLSPVLTQEDLLSLLACAPLPHLAESIARRVDVTEAVSDAIARTARTEAISALLCNHSATIRESTLDALVAGAAKRPQWHEPLVHRPALSAHSAWRLSRIITDQLLAVLAARPDLDPQVTADLRLSLEKRLAAPQPRRVEPAAHAGLSASQLDPLAEAARLGAAGTLSEARLIEAIRMGELERVNALLAVAAAVPLAAVQRAAKLRSAKAVVSLVWKAGFSMRIAGPLQSVLCNLTPGSMLRPIPSGGFPLGEEEMRWQLEFVTHP